MKSRVGEEPSLSTAIRFTGRPTASAQLLQNNASLWTLRRRQVSRHNQTGTILIKEGTLLPEAVAVR